MKEKGLLMNAEMEEQHLSLKSAGIALKGEPSAQTVADWTVVMHQNSITKWYPKEKLHVFSKWIVPHELFQIISSAISYLCIVGH